MFPRKWHHGHSLGVGALGALALYGYAPYMLIVVGVALGVAATCLTVVGFRLGRTLLAGFEEWRAASRARREAVRTRPEPVYGTKPGGAYNEFPEGY